jgi:hypothetical protein
MVMPAISVSQLVLNEIAWSPGDPGTGAPSFLAHSPAKFPLAPGRPPPHMNGPVTLIDLLGA